MAVYPLPYGVQVSAIYQNTPGVDVMSTYRATNKVIGPSLGRTLSAGSRGNMNVSLIPTASMQEPRGQQIDLRFSKVFELIGSQRLRGNLDFYNITNASDVLRMVTRYGSKWRDVQQVLGGRLWKAGLTFDF
jgi:hypothetical protein